MVSKEFWQVDAFASETFKSRMIGTDRAARVALTCVEDYLGRRLWSMDDGWRY